MEQTRLMLSTAAMGGTVVTYYLAQYLAVCTPYLPTELTPYHIRLKQQAASPAGRKAYRRG